MSLRDPLQMYEVRTFVNEVNFSGSGAKDFYVVSGSRMLITLLVTACDPGATVTLNVDNTFDADEAYEVVETLQVVGAPGRVKRVLSDFNNIFKLRYTVVGGNATVKVGVALFDNAITTKIENAQVSVNLSHLVDALGYFDSIRVGDGVDLLGINADGSLNVRFDTADDEITIFPYGEDPAVPTAAETVILTYTVPALKTAQLYRVECSGENIARYKVYKNGQPIGTKRTYFGGDLNALFDFRGPNKQALGLVAGDVIEVAVLHYRNVAGSFEAGIAALEKG